MDREENVWKEEVIVKTDSIEKENKPLETYQEEYSIELTPTISEWLIEEETISTGIDWWNFGVAYIGLIVSSIGIFIMPIYLGILGAAIGYLAKMKGEETIAPWAISLGVASVILGLFTALV